VRAQYLPPPDTFNQKTTPMAAPDLALANETW